MPLEQKIDAPQKDDGREQTTITTVMDCSGITVSQLSFQYGDCYFYHQLFQGVDVPIVFQSSYFRLARDPACIQRYKRKTFFFNLSFENLHQDPTLLAFQTELIRFEHKMNKWINKRYKKKFVWHHSYKYQGEDMIWTLTSKEMDQMVIFDLHKNQIPLESVRDKMYLRLRIHVEYIWFRKDTNIAGINYRILQIQINQLSLPTACLFPCTTTAMDPPPSVVNNNNPPSSARPVSTGPKIGTHPLFEKYFKMVLMGVPKQAIQQKMVMNQLPPEILDLSPEDEVPPQYQEVSATISVNTMDVLTQSISNGVELSKCEPKPPHSSLSLEKKIMITIDDITERLRSLRPIRKESSSSAITTTTTTVSSKQTILSILTSKLLFSQGVHK